MKACHAGKPVPKAEIQGDRCRNQKPHTCRGGNRRNSIPGGSPIPSYSPVGNNDACSYRKNGPFPYSRRSFFSVAEQQYGQEFRHRPEQGAPDQSGLYGQKGLGTADDKDGISDKKDYPL